MGMGLKTEMQKEENLQNFIDAIDYCKCKITNVLTGSPADSIRIFKIPKFNLQSINISFRKKIALWFNSLIMNYNLIEPFFLLIFYKTLAL